MCEDDKQSSKRQPNRPSGWFLGVSGCCNEIGPYRVELRATVRMCIDMYVIHDILRWADWAEYKTLRCVLSWVRYTGRFSIHTYTFASRSFIGVDRMRCVVVAAVVVASRTRFAYEDTGV